MNENRSIEQMVATWMTDEVGGRAPDRLLEDVLLTTGGLRPAARWLAVLKEPPMRVHSRVAVGTPARGPILALALAALLVLALAAAIVGASLLRAPQPLTSDDWPMFRGDATRAGIALRGPDGRPVVQWEFHAQGAVTQNISIVGDLVYVSSDEGVLHALRLADGAEQWRVGLAPGSMSGPAVANGLVYVWDATGSVHAFDARSGAERWRSSGSLGGGLSAPVVGGSLVYLGTSDGHFVAFDATSGAERWQAALSSSGAVNTPALGNGVLYVGAVGDGFFAVDAASGRIRWRLDTGQDLTQTAVLGDGIAYIGAAFGATTGHLRGVDVQTGRLLWQIDEPLQSPTLASGVAYSGGSDGLVTARDAATGIERWRIQLHGPTRPPAVVAGVVYVPADDEHRIYALDAATGGELWHFDLDGSNACCIAVAKGSVFVGTTPGTVYDIGGDGSNLTPAPAVAVAPSPSGPTAAATGGAPSTPAASASAVPEPVRFVWKAASPGGNFFPNGIALAPDGTLWAADPSSNRFALFTQGGSFVGYWGSSGTGDGRFRLTRSNGDAYGTVAFEPDGSFFVLDVGNYRVQAFDARRRFVKAWGGFGTGPGQYSDPVGMAVGRDGILYVLDDVRGVIEKYDRNGHILGSLSAFSNTTPGFNRANSLAIDSAGDLFVSQIDPNQVAEFDPSGKLLMIFGSEGAGQFQDQPGGMSIDAAGRLYIDQGPGRGSAPGVEVFDSTGHYLTAWGAPGSSDGDVTFPSGLVLDGAGNVYVGDAAPLSGSGEGRVEKFHLLPPLDK